MISIGPYDQVSQTLKESQAINPILVFVQNSHFFYSLIFGILSFHVKINFHHLVIHANISMYYFFWGWFGYWLSFSPGTRFDLKVEAK
jgi:hypothetical protein